jgi:predicted nucleic acid-binding protein
MKGYLLDTNALSDWLDSTKPRHASVSRRIEELAAANALLLTSTIVLGEIEYGIAVAPKDKQQSLAILLAQIDVEFVHKRLLLPVTRSTTRVYGDLRARLFEKYAGEKRKKGLRLEELVCPITAKVLGIQENDLWIAAQAIERNLVLVSNDGHMMRIRDVATALVVEDWGKTGGMTPGARDTLKNWAD